MRRLTSPDPNYANDLLDIPEWDADQAVTPIDESVFVKNADIVDGHSGRKQIDTRFENYSEAEVNAPRSCLDNPEIRGMKPNHSGVDNPAPVSIDRNQYPHRRY